jgi:hypothetical protein
MTVGAASMLFRTASSVASTTAANNGFSALPVKRGVRTGGSEERSSRRPVAIAKKISPLPWLAVDPVLASPRPARRASLAQAAESSCASVTTITMHDPPWGGCSR